MKLPRIIFDRRKSKARTPKRKFTTKEYVLEIDRYTNLVDVRSGETVTLENAIEAFGIIDVQLLDFVGSIFLDDKNWIIQPGFNRLFPLNDVDNDSRLLQHKLRLIRHMRKFEHRNAMGELEQVLRYNEAEGNKFTEFRYICLKGRIFMRWRKYEAALLEFDKAYTLLETRFSESEKVKLANVRVDRLNPVFDNPNWDHYIVDYDEINLGIYICTTHYLIDNVDDITNKLIKFAESEALKYESDFDIVSLKHLKSVILMKQIEYVKASEQLMQTMKYMDLKKLFNQEIVTYSDIYEDLMKSLVYSNQFEKAKILISKFSKQFDLNVNEYAFQKYLRLNVVMNNNSGSIELAFESIKNYVEFVQHKQSPKSLEDPMFVANYIYQYIILGIKMKKIVTRDEIEKYIIILENSGKNSEIIKIFVETAYLYLESKKIQKQNNLINYSDQFIKILDDLFNSTPKNDYKFLTVIIHYYYHLLLALKVSPEYSSNLVDLCDQLTDFFYNSPHVKLAIINTLIKSVLTDQLTKFGEWVSVISKYYTLGEVANLLKTIEFLDFDHKTGIQSLINIIENEICFSYMNKPLNHPISQVIFEDH